jgi:tetratricopeptide (TPR) repeat protein
MMEGDRETASTAIQEMLAKIPQSFVDEHAQEIAYLLTAPYELHLRFGEWDEMLAEPPPAPVPTLMCFWHFARGIAYAAQKHVGQARAERQAMLASRDAIPQDAKVRSASAKGLIDLADKTLLGEILYREGRIDAAIANLTEATGLEEQLPYTDPPLWTIPTRHALGATLMDSRRFKDAESVFREDLRRHLENGWSLYGLARSLRMQGKLAEAAITTARFQEAWTHADFKISSSCCCLPSKD